MKNSLKTDQGLIAEISLLRKRIQELEQTSFDNKIEESEWTEEALRESEEKYRFLFNYSMDAILLTTPDGSVLDANPAACEMFGRSLEEMRRVGRDGLVVMTDPRLHDALSSRTNKGYEMAEINMVRATGEIFPVEIASTIFVDASGQQRTSMIIRDITERKRTERALRESERDLAEAQRVAKIGSWRFDIRADEVAWSDELHRIFDIDSTEFGGVYASFLQRVHPDDRVKVLDTNKRALEEGAPFDVTYRILTRTNETKHIREIGYATRDDHGNVTSLFGTAQDITEHVQIEAALRESEKRLREVQKMARLGFWYWDVKTGQVEWSEEVYDIFGLDPKEFTPHIESIQALSPWPEDHRRDQELITRATENHGQGSYEQRFLLPDSSIGYYYSTFQGNYDECGTLFSIVGTVLDITERKRAEEALRISEEKYRRIAENIADVVWTADLNFNITYVSRSVERTIGESPDVYMQRTMKEKFPPESLRLIYAIASEELEREEHSDRDKDRTRLIELQHYRADGTTMWLAMNVSFVRDSSGNVLGFQGVSRDITARKEAEEKLQETLESLRRAISATIQVLTVAVEAKDPYTAGHQRRATDLARTIAAEMGLPPEKMEGIRMAGSIHDIGKISVPAEILSKPTRLSSVEMALIRLHAENGYHILKDVVSPWPLADIVYQHHERMDGSGYPRGLTGDEIMAEARVLAVADVVESMVSHRPYRPSLGLDAALAEIEKNKGVLYDPDVADACLRLFRENRFAFS